MTSTQSPEATPVDGGLAIAAPNERRLPLKTNVFAFMRVANTALAPMFPYTDEGSILPGVAIFSGAPGRRFGMFQHFNTVDEIAMVFGSKGTPLRVGQVMVGAREHYVNVGLRDPDDPESHSLLVVTQRQADRGTEQHEAITLICEKCRNPLHKLPFPSKPTPEEQQEIGHGYYPPFHTIIGTWQAANEFNADPARRTCGKCGHVSEPFPIENWGWQRYVEQCRAVDHARSAYLASVRVVEAAAPVGR